MVRARMGTCSATGAGAAAIGHFAGLYTFSPTGAKSLGFGGAQLLRLSAHFSASCGGWIGVLIHRQCRAGIVFGGLLHLCTSVLFGLHNGATGTALASCGSSLAYDVWAQHNSSRREIANRIGKLSNVDARAPRPRVSIQLYILSMLPARAASRSPTRPQPHTHKPWIRPRRIRLHRTKYQAGLPAMLLIGKRSKA